MLNKDKIKSYEQILQHVDAGTVDPDEMQRRATYGYRVQFDDGKTLMCGVGCLLTEQQLQMILQGDGNHGRFVHQDSRLIDDVVRSTNLTTDELQALQNYHDTGDKVQFVTYVKAQIERLKRGVKAQVY